MERDTDFTFLDRETSFQGTVSTDKLVLEGVIDGEVEATNKVYLKKGAVVSGAITTRKYILEDGSTHNGKVRLDPQKKPRPESSTPKQEKPKVTASQEPANTRTSGPVKPSPTPVRTDLEGASRENSDERLW